MSASEPAPSACLYWTAVSHPSQAVRKMLELKGVDYRLVNVLPEYTNPHAPLSVVYMPERFRPANVRRLIEHAVAYFGQENGEAQ